MVIVMVLNVIKFEYLASVMILFYVVRRGVPALPGTSKHNIFYDCF